MTDLQRILWGNTLFERRCVSIKQVGERFKVVEFSYDDTAARCHVAKGSAENEKKLANNLIRARTTVYELGACNPWELFVTLTLDKEKRDRHNLEKFHKDFARRIQNIKGKHGMDIKYMLIPEQHEDGAWHMHGFFMGLPMEQLHAFTLDEKLPHRIRQRLQQGKQVYTWNDYAQRFGFATMERVENREAAARYMLKYVTKDMARSVTDLGAHLYYASKGLKRAEVVAKGAAADVPMRDKAFRADFCIIDWFDNKDEALKYVDTRENEKAVL